MARQPVRLPGDAARRQAAAAVSLLVWMCGTLLVLGGLALWGLRALDDAGYNVPWYLGGELGTALCIVVAGIHVWFISGAAQKHSLRMVTQEASQNTLSSLLLLPMPPFQLALSLVVFPWLAAMRLAVALLPVYVFFVGMDGISWADLLMLYVVFALVSVSLPIWNRPALSDNIAEVTPSAAKSSIFQTTTTGRPAANRKKAMPFGGTLVYACFLLLETSAFTLRSGGFPALLRYVPEPVFTLVPSSILSWPLLMARGLIAPFDWFGGKVPPLPFALAFFLLHRYAHLVRVSEYLSVGSFHDLPQDSDLYAAPQTGVRAAARDGLRRDGLPVEVGGSRQWAGGDGSGGDGLLGFAYLLLLATLGVAMFRALMLGQWLISRKTKAEDVVAWYVPMASARRLLTLPFLCGLLFYLACCAFSWTAPFRTDVLALAGRNARHRPAGDGDLVRLRPFALRGAGRNGAVCPRAVRSAGSAPARLLQPGAGPAQSEQLPGARPGRQTALPDAVVAVDARLQRAGRPAAARRRAAGRPPPEAGIEPEGEGARPDAGRLRGVRGRPRRGEEAQGGHAPRAAPDRRGPARLRQCRCRQGAADAAARQAGTAPR